MHFFRIILLAVTTMLFTLSGCSMLVNTDDTTPPQPGSAGNIGILAAGADSVQLFWVAASDDQTERKDLQYRVYWSVNPDIDSFQKLGSNSTLLMDWTTNITKTKVTGLNPETTYYCNVFVKDKAENISSYLMRSVQTSDGTTPVPGESGQLSIDHVRKTSLRLHWNSAADNQSPGYVLQYMVVKSNANNIATVADARTNGTIVQDWLVGISSATVTGLEGATTYYFNVLTKDESGNVACYQSLPATTFTPRLFFSIRSAIISTNLDGSAIDTVLSIASDNFYQATDLAIDSEAGKLYWVDNFDYSNRIIKRANLDGSEVETILSPSDGVLQPTKITLDLKHQTLYWIDPTNQVIGRSKLDGTEAGAFWHFYDGYMWDIAVDGTAQKIYIASSFGIYTLTMNRVSQETVIDTNATEIQHPAYLTLDPGNGKMYWAENDLDIRGIRRANVDGTSIEELYQIDNSQLFTGLLLDFTRDKLYWSISLTPGFLQSGDLASSGPSPLTQIETISEGYDLRNPVLYDINSD